MIESIQTTHMKTRRVFQHFSTSPIQLQCTLVCPPIVIIYTWLSANEAKPSHFLYTKPFTNNFNHSSSPYSCYIYFSNSKRTHIFLSFIISHFSQLHAPVFSSIPFEPSWSVLSLQLLSDKIFNSQQLYCNSNLQKKYNWFNSAIYFFHFIHHGSRRGLGGGVDLKIICL